MYPDFPLYHIKSMGYHRTNFLLQQVRQAPEGTEGLTRPGIALTDNRTGTG